MRIPPREYKYHSGAPSEEEYIKGIIELENKLIELTKPLSINEIKFTEENIEQSISELKKYSTVQAYSESLPRLHNEKICSRRRPCERLWIN